MNNTELLIHGHSCCEIRSSNYSLVCDPWLLGSAYWRSWFNFPVNTNLEELINIWSQKKFVYFYITHIHWDHFHGPTIKKIIKHLPNNYKFLIPKTPEKRLNSDLLSIVNKNKVIELVHCKKYDLFDEISILSFQTGPFFSDSILSVSSKKFSLLNMNDAKLFKFSMNHLLSQIPKPQYVLRSHSSANSRCCLKDFNGKDLDSIDKKRIEYSKEFFEVCNATQAEYAIPFASNMACLHKETFKYNSILNFSDYVIDDFKQFEHKYEKMKCLLLLPTEKIVLEKNKHYVSDFLRNDLKKVDRQVYLSNYQKKMSNILENQYLLEEKSKVNAKFITKYFIKIINSTPIILKKYLSNNIFLRVNSEKRCDLFNIDFINKKVDLVNNTSFRKNNVVINVHPFVINDVCSKSHWNSLGVSKRLEVWINQGNNRYQIFKLLCNTVETQSFLPLRNIFNSRFIFIWIRRYREIFDLTRILIKTLLYKNNPYKNHKI